MPPWNGLAVFYRVFRFVRLVILTSHYGDFYRIRGSELFQDQSRNAFGNGW